MCRAKSPCRNGIGVGGGVRTSGITKKFKSTHNNFAIMTVGAGGMEAGAGGDEE